MPEMTMLVTGVLASGAGDSDCLLTCEEIRCKNCLVRKGKHRDCGKGEKCLLGNGCCFAKVLA